VILNGDRVRRFQESARLVKVLPTVFVGIPGNPAAGQEEFVDKDERTCVISGLVSTLDGLRSEAPGAGRMTRCERLMAAMRCEQPDRPPVRVYGATPAAYEHWHPSYRPQA